MKRKFWNLLQAAAVCVAMVVALPSCDGDDEITGDDDDDDVEVVDPDVTDPDDTTGGDDGTTTTGENVFVTTDCITPIRYAEGNYYSEGTEDVTITVNSLTTDNIVFSVIPSSEVKSYLVQVYPLASVYNTFLNQMNSAGASSLTLEEDLDYMSQIVCLVESESSGGKLMNEETLGSDYADYEFDWGNSGYLYFTIQQEAEYLITVQACFDEAGENLADLCLVHVTTPTVAVQGSPEVTADIEVGYSSYVCTFVPNSDCYYLYYLVGDYDEIYQFVNAYGESMYRDFIRHYGGRATVGSTELEAYASNLSEEAHMVATAIPLDFNGTPAANVFFEEFYLNARPEGRVAASATMTNVKTSATVAYNTVEMDMYTRCIYYNIVDRATGEGYQSADDETRESYAEQLAQYGWGISNPNYSFDRTNDVYTGTSGSAEDYWPQLTAGAEYMLVWVAQNAYGDITDLCFSDPFEMKTLVRDAPETSKEDVVFTIPETGRTSVTVDFTYTWENTAVYYFQNYAPTYDNETYVFPDTRDDSDEARYGDYGWLYWLIDYRDDYSSPWPNIWLADDAGHADWTYFGFDSDTQYEFVLVAEDWDGVLGYLKFATGITTENAGGPNPEITSVTWDPEYSDTEGRVTFTTNDDAKMLYYSVVDYTSGHSTSVGLSDLLKRGSGDYYKSEYLPMWEDWLIEYGLTSSTTTGRVSIALDSKISIALGMAVGVDEEGNPVYTDLYAYVYTPDVGLQTFEDYWSETGVTVDPVESETETTTVSLSKTKDLSNYMYVPAMAGKNSSDRVRPTSRLK